MANIATEQIDFVISAGISIKDACLIVRDALIETGCPPKVAGEFCFAEWIMRCPKARRELGELVSDQVWERLQ